MKLYDIIKQDYNAGIVVDVNFSYEHVTLLDRDSGESIFLQGDDATEFIRMFRILWAKCLPDELIKNYLARPYLGNQS